MTRPIPITAAVANSPTIRKRLLSKLIIDPSGCLLWTGVVDEDGYGRVGIGRRYSSLMVHRVMWELFEGPIPEDLALDHVKARGCFNKRCASIAHLEPVTWGENVLRGDGPVAENARKTHCDFGHEYTPQNTYLNPGSGSRRCRTCAAATFRETTARRRAAKERARRGEVIPLIQHIKTHCINGHELTPGNAWLGIDGERKCRTCNREQKAASRAKRKAIA